MATGPQNQHFIPDGQVRPFINNLVNWQTDSRIERQEDDIDFSKTNVREPFVVHVTSTVSLILSDRMAQNSKIKFKTNKKGAVQPRVINNNGFEKRVLTKGCLTQNVFFYMIERVIYVYKQELQELTDLETKQLQQLLLNQLN